VRNLAIAIFEIASDVPTLRTAARMQCGVAFLVESAEMEPITDDFQQRARPSSAITAARCLSRPGQSAKKITFETKIHSSKRHV
jgi:hypothetical protein